MPHQPEFVAHKKARCSICTIPQPGWSEVNAAIWDGFPSIDSRTTDYRESARRTAALYGVDVEVKVVTRHAEHIEADARVPTPQRPESARETNVMPADYESITDRAARLGSDALESLHQRLPMMEDRDIIAVAKMGVGARQHQAAMAAKDRRKGDTTIAIFGFVSGHMANLPEHEVLDVTPPSELREGFEEERALLEARARG